MVAAAKSGAKARERRRQLEESQKSGSAGVTARGNQEIDGNASAATAAGAASVIDNRLIMVNDSASAAPASALSGEGQEQEEEQQQDEGSEDALTDFTDFPMSFGERLILETCMRFRQRPYDRQRQDFLSRPKRRGDMAQAWLRSGSEDAESGAAVGGAPRHQTGPASEPSAKIQERVLNSEETNSLVARLSQPKRVKHSMRPPGEQIILRNRDKDQAKIESGVNINDIVARLSTPRTARMTSPTPGERMVLMWNKSDRLRPVDFDRINYLAKATRRGGSAQAWGIRAATAAPATAGPQSAREPRRGGLPTRGKHAAGLGATEEQRAPTRGRDVGEQSDAFAVEDVLGAAPDESAGTPEEAMLPGIDLPDRSTSGSPKDFSGSQGANWSHPWRNGVDSMA